MLSPRTTALWLLVLLNACISTLALLPSGVIFPLYIYPGDNCVAWAPLISAIRTNTVLQFYLIINPASGPGAAGTQPDTTYQACIATLRSTGAAAGGNVKLLGYVATGYGSRTSSLVTTDIHTYSQWATTYRPEGIFFDEVATAANQLSTYQTYSTKVHTDFGTSYIVFNPGAVPATTGYYGISDLIVTFEGFYNDFDASDLIIGPSSPSRKQAVILHTGPTQIPSQIVQNLASIIKVGASFITDFPNAIAYQNFPTDWNGFLGDLVSAQTA
ncbi:Spherulin-4 [Hypsizygus marmoreus]|uniref:Spherulin-4 n=1 Tax=Hypsizygus marmoreus TaxID=39966 RepID=A0A369K2H8_HYPMA|nr:Spherulin-4 [Hypsizygus marmoreus]